MTETFASLALLWLAAAVTPGPNFFAVMHLAAGTGRRAALAGAFGTATGTVIWAAAGFFGLKSLFAAFPDAAALLKLAGALYLMWIAFGLWRSAGTQATAGLWSATRASRAFLLGLTTNLANPKTAVFAASIFAVALPAEASTAMSLGAVALVCTISLSWYLLLAAVGSTAPFTRAYARARGPLLRLTGTLFAGFGLKLVLER